LTVPAGLKQALCRQPRHQQAKIIQRLAEKKRRKKAKKRGQSWFIDILEDLSAHYFPVTTFWQFFSRFLDEPAASKSLSHVQGGPNPVQLMTVWLCTSSAINACQAIRYRLQAAPAKGFQPLVHPKARALATLPQRPDKSPPVLVVPDNELSPVPAGHDVI
jgi:hypothetical protein